MPSVNLKKIILKRELLSLLRGLVTMPNSPIVIQDHEGKILIADLGMQNIVETDLKPLIPSINTQNQKNNSKKKLPILLGDEIIGWVVGIEQVE